MYFTSPRQLPEIYGQLEEANLFLIQNAQETEDILEDLKNKEKEVRSRMDAENASLRTQVERLEAQIASEEAKADALLNGGASSTKSKKSRVPCRTSRRRRVPTFRWSGSTRRRRRCTPARGSRRIRPYPPSRC